jgi:hypothetical protein
VAADGARALDLTAVVHAFRADGYARLGPVVGAAGLERLRTRADDLMLGRVSHEGFFFQHDAASGRYEDLEYGLGWEGPSLRYRKIEKLERDPVFRALVDHPLYERVAREVLYGDEHAAGEVVIYRAVLFCKAAEGGSPLPWHQDGGLFWGVEPSPVLQIWTALDDAPGDGGCLEVIPRTHLDGLATPHGGRVPDDLVQGADAEARAVRLPATAGEAILVHNQVWHRSGRSLTGTARRALSVCYMTSASRCLRTRRAPREFVRVFVPYRIGERGAAAGPEVGDRVVEAVEAGAVAGGDTSGSRTIDPSRSPDAT